MLTSFLDHWFRSQCLSKTIHYTEKAADGNDVWAAVTRDPLERLVLGLEDCENKRLPFQSGNWIVDLVPKYRSECQHARNVVKRYLIQIRSPNT